MSLKELQSEAAELSAAERRRLIAYLVTLENSDDADHKSRLSAKIDSSLDNWIELDQLDEQMSEKDDAGK